MKSYPHLATPIQIGKVTVKNRIFMAPMDTGFGNDVYGNFTPEGVEYFVRRAAGGFGLLYSGGTNTDSTVDIGAHCILDCPDAFRKTGMALNSRMRAYNAKMFIQLTLNIGRNAGLKTPSPLPVLRNPNIITKELTVEEIQLKVDEIGQAAKLCREAGYPGVDIHALHWGHLIDSFALSCMNHRTDQYGGSLENRLRIAKEVVESIKKYAGNDYPVTMRLALKSYMKGFDKASFDGSEEVGRTLEEAIEIAKLLESWGYDGLSTDAGTLDGYYYAMPPAYVPTGYTLDMAAAVKKAVSIPVLCGSRMADPDMDEQAIADGKIDAVVVGRQAFADPDFVNKVISGKPETVRTCIGCNQGCIWGYFTRGRVSCAVNPEVGYERDLNITKSPEPKKVIIVGGGVAGMEAARVATLRGHRVSLYEKTDVLGGNLIPAGSHDFKKEVLQLNEYYKNEMKRLNIDIHLNTEMTIEMLEKANADAIILAVGSRSVVPRIDGIHHSKVVLGIDALLHPDKVGERVVIVGGGLTGCEIAYGYAKDGKKVTIVEALDDLMKGDIPDMNRMMLMDGFEYYKTNILTQTMLKSVNDDGAIVELSDHSVKMIPADTVILSIGYRPLESMASKLANCGAVIYEIGDGNRVGNIMTAIQDAYEVAYHL